MEIMDERKKKVDAERLRRKKINYRLDHLRNILALSKDMTRIQILKYSADKLIGIPLTNTSTTEYKSDPLYLITAKPYEQNKFLVHNDSITDKVKFTKASIEQYRRRLERIEYDRIHSFLGGEKMSDIQLLDKLIEIIENIENFNRNQNLNMKLSAPISSPLTTAITTMKIKINKRKGLKLSNNNDNNNNQFIHSFEQSKIDKSIKQNNQFYEYNQIQKINNLQKEIRMNKYWRPWEDEENEQEEEEEEEGEGEDENVFS
ncbi:unnamed protein product [Schistosoma intercalatum]|nr:unnamed protein product [Schistosoma intercalatum]